MIVIDGYQWPVPCRIKRVAKVESSDVAGLMLDKTYFNDVLGTYLEYSVVLAVPTNMMNQYAELYETLTAPVDGHTFVMPYNESTIEITARVGQVEDVWVYTQGAKQYWRGVTFTVTANHPSKEMTLGEAITQGRTPMPERMSVPLGAYAQMTSDGWEFVSLPNGDEIRY